MYQKTSGEHSQTTHFQAKNTISMFPSNLGQPISEQERLYHGDKEFWEKPLNHLFPGGKKRFRCFRVIWNNSSRHGKEFPMVMRNFGEHFKTTHFLTTNTIPLLPWDSEQPFSRWGRLHHGYGKF